MDHSLAESPKAAKSPAEKKRARNYETVVEKNGKQWGVEFDANDKYS